MVPNTVVELRKEAVMITGLAELIKDLHTSLDGVYTLCLTGL